jgi:2-methylisocitrate lyase-like PEP mutase family enzyme
MNSKRSLREKAGRFRELHHADRLLLLPNAWDVPSARVFEDAGFPAVATSSAAIAVSHGYPDGEQIPKHELFPVVRRIADSLAVPLSADIESGYGPTLEELTDTVRRVVDAGAIGVNIEDVADFAAHRLYSIEEQVERIATVRTAASFLGVPLVVNARTDADRLAPGDKTARLEEAIRRALAYKAAGADCLYPIGLTDRTAIRRFVRAVDHPVNVMARKGTPPVRELAEIGVRRLSLGPGPMYASIALLKRIGRELREAGTYRALTKDAIGFDELNALGRPRR